MKNTTDFHLQEPEKSVEILQNPSETKQQKTHLWQSPKLTPLLLLKHFLLQDFQLLKALKVSGL